MNKRQTTTLKYLLSGVFLLVVASLHAQTTNNPTDTTIHHRYGMHRWGNPNGGDSTRHLHRGPGGFNGGQMNNGRDGWAHRGFGRDGYGPNAYAHRGFGRNGFGHRGFGRRGFGGEHIRYTPEQRKQIASINQDYRKKTSDLYKQDNLTLKQYKAGLVALQKEKKDKLAALLTPEQKNEIAASRKRMDENRQVREAAHLERLKLHLNLSDDQVAKIKAGNESLHSQVKAIHENDNLLPQQKMEQMKALMAKRDDTYKTVLTSDQYTQFENELRQKIGGK